MIRQNSIESATSMNELKILYCAGNELAELKAQSNLSLFLTNLIIAEDGQSGLELFKKHQPDIIISTADLPIIDGISMCQNIRELDANVAIILVAPDRKMAEQAAINSLALSDFILSPTNLNELMASIFKTSLVIEKNKFLATKAILKPTSDPEEHYEKQMIKGYIDRYMQSDDDFESIRCFSMPKSEVNGDFYVAARYKNSHYVLIADGVGHGLAAILPALQIPSLFQRLAEQGLSLDVIASEINKFLFIQHHTGHFVASTLIKINSGESLLSVLNCGNPSAVLINGHRKILHKFKSSALALGTVQDEQYQLEVEHFHFNEDAYLYAVTDGLLETLKKNDSSLTSSSLHQMFTASTPRKAYDTITALIQSVAVEDRIDDVTLCEIPVKTSSNENISSDIKPLSQPHSLNHYLNNELIQELSTSVFLASSLAITITDKNNRFVFANPAFYKITGYQQEEVIGKDPKLLSSGKHDAQFYQNMWLDIDTKGEWHGEIWNRHKNGALYLEWLTINAITDKNNIVTHYCSVFSDDTERKMNETVIKKLTYHDDLTGLPNRRLFLDRLEQEIKTSNRTKSPFVVLFLDLDNFKEVNDTLGHHIGDLVLQESAQRLRECVRETDTVARLGGDEFAICLCNLNALNLLSNVTDKLLDSMKNPFSIADELIYISVSIGVSIFPKDANTTADLIKNADQAMYFAKDKGRNQANFFTASMQQQALERKNLSNDLRTALHNNEFKVYYQPIVNITTNTIYKAEALIRWEHPERGFISPTKFIPIAEDNGMIVEIGDWVFRQAALAAAKWQKKYHPEFQISINKSPKQFQHVRNGHQDWLAYLKSIGLPATSIVIEITEGLLMDSNISDPEQLHMLSNTGIRISLDDFGTGYSSLSYLKKFDIDYIKIDRAFVQNLSDNQDDQALCEAIIVMANKLGIEVIAEGIELQEQQQLLFDAGCDYGQGYLFSKPVPEDEFEKLMNVAYCK
jgi:diguanylate cyclase (GGDEF)-like protein/PAS domain S-box-containing protein